MQNIESNLVIWEINQDELLLCTKLVEKKTCAKQNSEIVLQQTMIIRFI